MKTAMIANIEIFCKFVSAHSLFDLTKKELLLRSGLDLFATEGYAATSTSKIAANAGVSEGLIFRHFTNKEGLVKAIFAEGELKFKELYARLFEEQDPSKVISYMIELPLDLHEDQYDFWRLQYRLKWELRYFNADKTQLLIDKLTWAFTELDYEDPVQEAEFIHNYIEGLANHTLLGRPLDKEKTKVFLLKKYGISEYHYD